jgi:small subunit ribosomal protein S12
LATLNYRVIKLNRIIKKKLHRPKLKFSPQRKCMILRLRICTPRKPNSARRPCIKGHMTSNCKVLAYIPGSGHTLRRHSKVLLRGGGARDLPVVNYSCIRHVYDFEPLYHKKRRRSIYGVRLTLQEKKYVKKELREFIN